MLTILHPFEELGQRFGRVQERLDVQLVRVPLLDLVIATLIGSVGVVRLAVAEFFQLARKLIPVLGRHRITGTFARQVQSSSSSRRTASAAGFGAFPSQGIALLLSWFVHGRIGKLSKLGMIQSDGCGY
jgi:hypothetical protein